MEVKYYGNANKLDFFNVILNSVLDDYNKSTNEIHELNELVLGLSFQKLIGKHKLDFLITKLDITNLIYSYEVKSSKSINKVSFEIKDYEDGIEVTYYNEVESIGFIQNINDNLVKILVSKSRKKSILAMLSSINDYCLEEKNNA